MRADGGGAAVAGYPRRGPADLAADAVLASAATGASADGTGKPADLMSVDGVAALAAHENFPVALRLLPRRHREHLMAVYVFARTVDDIGDRAPAADRPRLLAEVEADVRALYDRRSRSRPAPGAASSPDAEGPRSAAVRGLASVVSQCAIPMKPFTDLIEANKQDQAVTRYQTFDDLLGYCQLSANPVGRIVLYVFGAFTPARAELSDSICTGLQLAEHWQDVAEDLQAGRIYLPAQDMATYGCDEQALASPHASRPVRRLIAFEVNRARSLIDAGAPLVGTLRGSARAAVAGYVAGGRAALAAIADAGYDVLAGPPRPRRTRTMAELARAYARAR